MKRMFLKSVALLCLLAAPSAARAQTAPPVGAKNTDAPASGARRVRGRAVTSRELPALTVTFDKAFKYLGTQSFILYDVAYAEQHFFADADPQGRIKRLYWLQFENYLPTNTHSYTYSEMKESVDIGGFKFMTDARPVSLAMMQAHQRPDSDGARARAFLESKGFRVAGGDILMRRLVHLADPARRYELLIIYIEDMTGTGLTAADLSPNGPAASRWPEVSKGLLERALKGFKISRK